MDFITATRAEGLVSLTWTNIPQSLKSWSTLKSQQKGMLKNVEDKNHLCIMSQEIPQKKNVMHMLNTLWQTLEGFQFKHLKTTRNL